MKTTVKYLFASFVACLLLGSCIKNDIPYPRIQPNVLSLTVADQLKPAEIDIEQRLVTVFLDEAADIYSVKVEECSITPDARFVDGAIEGTLDLSSPKQFILRIYQDYVWTVRAVQNIERYFTVANQIGASVIDVAARRVLITLPSTVDVHRVKVTSAKLGSVNSTIIPDILDKEVDLSKPLTVEVTDYGRTAPWTIYAEVTEAVVTTESVDAWTNVAWVYGQAQEGRDNSVEYRRADSDDWIRVPDPWLNNDGGSIVARLVHLESLTKYVARAVSNDDKGNEIEFTTGVNVQLPNSDFDNWWLDKKVWNPWAEGGTPFWDTGNKGAATLGQSNTQPTDDTPTGTGKAAMLETKFVGIGMIGKLAAGNIFTGSYVRTDGTNGILSFGREFAQRPTAMRGYFKYHSAPISSVTAGYEHLKGQPDTCAIWIALIDSPEPFEIRTNPSNRNLFDPNGDYVVAYGTLNLGYDVPNYQPFEVPLVYKSTSRVPTYVIAVGSASKYGDFFTGGNGSVLYLDDIELVYDYEN